MKLKTKLWVLLPLVAIESAALAAPLFIESLAQGPLRPVPESLMLEKVRASGRDKKQYLSLGETHLYPEFNRAYSRQLAALYLQEASAPVNSCVEDMQEPVEQMPLYVFLRDHSASFWLSPGNGPSQTNFKKCSDASKKWLTYSGLFHQYPMAPRFPLDFESTPVTQKPGNTISSQLTQQKGLFISTLDLVYIENQTTLNVLRAGLPGPGEFRDRVASLEKAFVSVSSALSRLTPQLLGAFLDRNAFPASPHPEATPEQAFLLLVDPEYRQRPGLPHLLLLDRLARANDSWLGRFLAFSQSGKARVDFTNLFDFVDEKTLQALPFHFGTIEREFEPGTEFLIVSMGGDEQRILTASPSQTAPVCFHVPASLDEPTLEMACDGLSD